MTVVLRNRADYLHRWEELHGGYDPRTRSRALRGWLSLVYRLGRPLARAGVSPAALTAGALGLAGGVVVLADLGGHWAVGAGLVVVLSALLDSLDGCVAVLQDRTTAWGAVLDNVVDRISDSAYLLAAVLVGCPVPLAVGCGFACLLMEYLRARAGEVGVITPAERPTRVILLAVGLLLSERWDGAPALATAALLALTVGSTVQLAVALRRQLRGVG